MPVSVLGLPLLTAVQTHSRARIRGRTVTERTSCQRIAGHTECQHAEMCSSPVASRGKHRVRSRSLPAMGNLNARETCAGRSTNARSIRLSRVVFVCDRWRWLETSVVIGRATRLVAPTKTSPLLPLRWARAKARPYRVNKCHRFVVRIEKQNEVMGKAWRTFPNKNFLRCDHDKPDSGFV